MLGVAKLVLIYLLVLSSGAKVVVRLPLRNLLDRVLMAFTFGAAQLLISIQILSLFRQLTGAWLLLLNAGITSAVLFAAHRPSHDAWNLRRAEMMGKLLTGLRWMKQHPLEGAMLGASLIAMAIGCATSLYTYPITDDYHFAMPLFWKQHASILPFPTHDPRLIGVTFASEALAFPGFLYARTGAMPTVFAGLAGVLLVWIVIGTARQLGATLEASICAGAILLGFGPISVSYFSAGADQLLCTMWFGGAVYFLVASRSREGAGIGPLEMGCSLMCLLMSAGSKNVVALAAPSYALGAVLLHGRHLFGRRCLTLLAMYGLAGVIGSGVLWSYVSNVVWFGNIKGDRDLKSTVSTEHHPRAIWTRVTRGAVTMLYDAIWLPQSYREAYEQLCVRSVRLLGGQDQLAEDKDYYSFSNKELRPGQGFGLLGVLFFIPGLLCGVVHACRRRSSNAPGEVFPISGVLVLIVLGSFLTNSVVLRWQCIGLARLLLPSAMAGIPLIAWLCERRSIRFAGVAVLFISLAMYSFSGLGVAFRRLNLDERFGLARKLTSLQRDRSMLIDYRWQEGPSSSFRLREVFTRRELHQLVLSRIPASSVIGMNGQFWSGSYYLFGKGYSNRVVSLMDSRSPYQFIMPVEVDYILIEESALAAVDPQTSAKFDFFFEAKHDGKPILTVLKRKTLPSPQRNAREEILWPRPSIPIITGA